MNEKICLLALSVVIIMCLCSSSPTNENITKSFYEGSEMISKVGLILNEEIIDFETKDTSTVVYFDNDIVFRNSIKVNSRERSMGCTLEFDEIESDKIKQFLGIIFNFLGDFSDEELQLIDDMYEAYTNNDNYSTTYNRDTVTMTIKTVESRKILTMQYSCKRI